VTEHSGHTGAQLREAIEKQAHQRARVLLERYAAETTARLNEWPAPEALQAAESAKNLLKWALLATRCALAHDETELLRLQQTRSYGALAPASCRCSLDLQG
jgi:hypothetical protein